MTAESPARTSRPPELVEAVALAGRAYDLAARKYHHLFQDEMRQKPYDRELLDGFAAQFEPGATICDLGCGPSAHIGRYLSDKGLRVLGADLSGACVEIAAACNPGIPMLSMDMADLGLRDQSVDGILSFYSIIHAPKRFVDRFFQEFRRVLRPGGKILVTVKQGEEEGYLEEFLGFATRVYFAHFTEEEIRGCFRRNGLKLSFLKTREPMEEEMPVARIYAAGEKL